jgi:RND family efflux transporter MFP subunit
MNKLGLKLALVAVLAAAGAVVAIVLTRTVAQVAVVKRGKAVDARPGSVTVQAEYQMELKSEVGGRLIRSELDPGKLFKLEAFIAQVDPGDLQLEIARIESDYETAKQRIAIGSQVELEYANAKDSLENLERLTKTGNYPEAELVKQRRSVEQIRQKLEQEKLANQQSIALLENALKVNKRKLEKMTLSAPFDGVVSEVLARPGDIIAPNIPLATLISTSRTVEARISEENFANIRIGQKATVRFLTYGENQYAAKVVKILPTADPATQRNVVHLEVEIAPEKLVPGITGEVVIEVGEHERTLIVPRRAVFGTNLYAVNGGRVELRKVKIGYISLNLVEILSGVQEGELVIVEQPDRYQPGDHVRTAIVPE